MSDINHDDVEVTLNYVVRFEYCVPILHHRCVNLEETVVKRKQTDLLIDGELQSEVARPARLV